MARDPYGDHNPTTTWPVILTVITTRPTLGQLISLLLSTLFLLLLTHGVTFSRPRPLSTGTAIDRFNIHSAEVSTLYPHHGTHGLALPFGWTNGVPTKPIYCHGTLPAVRLTPHWASPGWPRVYQRHNDHRRGPSQTGTKALIIQLRAHKVISAYRARVRTPITFPSWRHR